MGVQVQTAMWLHPFTPDAERDWMKRTPNVWWRARSTQLKLGVNESDRDLVSQLKKEIV